jgi:hypothetical protein
VDLRVFACHEERMLRSMHARWPYRRSHCRHDLHWLVRVQQRSRWCTSARAHTPLMRNCNNRRPEED